MLQALARISDRLVDLDIGVNNWLNEKDVTRDCHHGH
jgi:hypothetical protein